MEMQQRLEGARTRIPWRISAFTVANSESAVTLEKKVLSRRRLGGIQVVTPPSPHSLLSLSLWVDPHTSLSTTQAPLSEDALPSPCPLCGVPLPLQTTTTTESLLSKPLWQHSPVCVSGSSWVLSHLRAEQGHVCLWGVFCFLSFPLSWFVPSTMFRFSLYYFLLSLPLCFRPCCLFFTFRFLRGFCSLWVSFLVSCPCSLGQMWFHA